MGSMSCSRLVWVERKVENSARPMPFFSQIFHNQTTQHPNHCLKTIPIHSIHQKCMILDAWEGNLWAQCLSKIVCVELRLKIQLSQSQFSARFFTTKQHDTQTIASKPASQFTQYTIDPAHDSGWFGRESMGSMSCRRLVWVELKVENSAKPIPVFSKIFHNRTT
jgi:hypothetical protein